MVDFFMDQPIIVHITYHFAYILSTNKATFF
jgi:hypothetical protein